MDIDKTTFPGNFLTILKHISEAHFVAIDLELSGVSTKTKNRSRQTLEERYQETKAAATQFQILQVGLTCVKPHHDTRDDTYHYQLRPYNFSLSPLIAERLDLDRVFAFSSSAAAFLLSHNFDLTHPFTHGIPYLSRPEATQAFDIAIARLDRSAYTDIALDPADTATHAFVEEARAAITQWLASPGSGPTLEITSRSPLTPSPLTTPPSLGQFEKRLLHQLVRSSFPTHITLSRPSSILIQPLDPAREASMLRSKKRDVRERIARQTGFRWVVEALASDGDLSRLKLETLAKDPVAGGDVAVDIHDVRARFHDAAGRLGRGRPVLVGHNCFTDMVYFYAAFVGALPDTVAGFQERLHEVFPVVVDTKYLATRGPVDISHASSLQEMAESVSRQVEPRVESGKGFGKYEEQKEEGQLHEAGYDSYLTALVMVRLAAKLRGEEIAEEEQSAEGVEEKNEIEPVYGTENDEDSKVRKSGKKKSPAPTQHMPPFTDPFWKTYRNKLRVYGTVEGVLEIDESEDEEDTDEFGGPLDGGGVSLSADAEEWAPDEEDDKAFAERMAELTMGKKKGKGKNKRRA